MKFLFFSRLEQIKALLPKSENEYKMKKNDDRIIDITKDVKWIGVLDYDIRTFDIVMTYRIRDNI